MIRRLRGRLAAVVDAGELVIDVGGVGYQVFCTASDQARLPRLGEPVELSVYTHVRDDALQLYGFLDERDRRHFVRLLQVTGVGPRVALQIVSALPGDRLVQAIRAGEMSQLTRIPGVGKKTAQRLLLELAGAFDDEPVAPGAGAWGLGVAQEVEEALMSLGYREGEAREAVDRALTLWREEQATSGGTGEGALEVADLLRRALKVIGSERHGA